MGERIIRPGIRTSEAVAENIRKGGWMSGVIYVFLLTIVDDFGRYDARPAILKSELFPFLQDLVREADVQRSLENMSRAGLVRLYSHDGKPYLEIQKFNQRLRAKRSKWPAPIDTCQPHEIAGQCHDNVVTMPTDTDTDTDTEEKEKSKERAGKFVPPTPSEVSEYGKSIGFAIDGVRFCAFYESKGWVVGKSPMKNWKAAVQTWKGNSHSTKKTEPVKTNAQDLGAMLKMQGLV